MWAIEEEVKKPATFLEIGGHKIFRDLIYNAGAFFRADHIFYKEHNLYDFPQKNIKLRLSNYLFALLLKIPKIRKLVNQEARQRMIEPLQKVLED